MSSYTLQCDGTLNVTVEGAPLCSGTWLVHLVPEPFDASQIDPAMVGAAFAIGFGLIASVWLLGFPIRAVLSLIR